MIQERLDLSTVLLLSDQALIHKVGILSRVAFWNRRYFFSAHRSDKMLVSSLALPISHNPVKERWVACSKLKREGSKRPYVDFFRICHTFEKLRCCKTGRTFVTLFVYTVLRQKAAEAQVSQFYFPSCIAKYVIGLYITVQNVFVVHSLETQGNLVQAPLTEVLSELSLFLLHDVAHLPTVHVIEEHI